MRVRVHQTEGDGAEDPERVHPGVQGQVRHVEGAADAWDGDEEGLGVTAAPMRAGGMLGVWWRTLFKCTVKKDWKMAIVSWG